jgi:hypothetical protein
MVLAQSFNLSEEEVKELSNIARLATLVKDESDESSFIAM